MRRNNKNPRSELVSAFQSGFVEDLQDEHEQAVTDGPQHALQAIDAFLRVGFEASAKEKITEFEESYGIDFAELVADCQAAHLEDPR